MSEYQYDSPRRVAVETIRRLCREVRNGSYFVKRGAISWTDFPWDKYPRAISIQFDRASLFRPHGMNEADVTLEVAGRLSTDSPEIDDGLLEEFVDDIMEVIGNLMQAKDSGGDPVVFKVVPTDSWVVEFHDSGMGLQGIIATFGIGY